MTRNDSRYHDLMVIVREFYYPIEMGREVRKQRWEDFYAYEILHSLHGNQTIQRFSLIL